MPVLAPVLGNIALNLAIGVGVSVLASALRPQQKAKPRSTQRVQTQRGFSFEMDVGEGVPYSAVFGLGRARGALHYWNEYGTGDDYHLQLVIRIGVGEHDGLETFLVDEKPVTLTGSNSSSKGKSVVEYTVGGTPYLWVKYYTGAPGQAADAELDTRSNPSGRWTSASKMTGWAYMIVTVRYNADLFPGALPLFGSVWRGLKLYDWRDEDQVWGDPSTYTFTKNPAVIRWNFRRGIWVNGVKALGMGFSAFANDLAYYTAAANVCDELVEYPETESEIPRYEYGREIGDDEEKLTVLQELDASYCGSSFKRGGADAPLPAQQLVSAMTLTDGDRLLGYPVRTDRKGTVSAKKTMWHGQFVSADQSWGLAPFSPRINADLESLLGGRRSVALDQPYERSQERAQARAEIALRRQFYPATRVETFAPKAFRLEPGDAITRVCDWGSMLMVVERTEPLPDRTGVTVTMSQWDNAIVPVSGEEFITLPSEPGAGPADPDRTIAVSGLDIEPFSREGGGAVHPYGKATWTQITDPNVDQVMIRVWPSAGTEADDKEDFFADSRLTSTKLVGPLQPETEYTYKAIPIRRDARATVWTNTDTFTTGAETVPTDIPPGTITTVELNTLLQNVVGILTGDGPGSLVALLDQLRNELDDVAAGVTTNTMASDRDRKVLSSQVGLNAAAVIAEATTRADAISALAQQIIDVAAQSASGLAEGLFSVRAISAPAGVEVRLAMIGRVTTLVDFVEAGLYIDIINDGGVYRSRIVMKADQIAMTDGDETHFPFVFQAGALALNVANIGTVNAGIIQGAQVYINLNTSFFSFGI